MPMPSWEMAGFGAEPEAYSACGSERVLRAYARSTSNVTYEHGTSKWVGNCFFVPSCGYFSGPIAGFTIGRRGLTGAYLEERLNAFFWGNNFERITVWALNPGARYLIGPVGQDTRYEVRDRKTHALVRGRHHGWPGAGVGDVRQVCLDIPELADGARLRLIRSLVRPVDDFAVSMPLTRAGHA